MSQPLRSMTHASVALGLFLIVASSVARADITIETFDDPNYTPELAFSFADPNNTITPGPTSWTIDLTTSDQSDYYGYARSIVSPTDFFDISSETTLELDFTLNDAGVFGTEVFVVLEDFLGGVSVYKQAFGLGSHVMSATLASPTFTDGTGPADLTDLTAIQVQANSFAPPPGGGGGAVSAPFSITLSDLSATNPIPPDPSVVTDFNNVGVFPGYDNWATAAVTTGPDSLNVVSSGFGGAPGAAFETLDASDATHAEIDVTINSSDVPLNIIALLEDADGTQNVWRWYGLDSTNGIGGSDNHLLSFRMETVTTDGFLDPPVLIDNANSWQAVPTDFTPGDPNDNAVLDLDNLVNFHIQVQPDDSDPNGSYDISFNHFSVKEIAGGFDTDNDSDGLDFLTWQLGLTPHGGGSVDLLEWENNYGNVVASTSSLQQVPEPASGSLLLLGIVVTSCRRVSRWRVKHNVA